ncbi:MAG: signal peptidase I [Paenisporosarcina sp.]
MWEWTKAIVLGLIVVIVIRSFFFTNYSVSGKSMMPTLKDQDKVIVSKISYTLGQVDRMDVLVFHGNENEDYVKRVIGLPGDLITYENDQLFVNNKRIDEPYLESYPAFVNPNENLTEDFKLEELTGSFHVPKDSYFVMGDNRRQSFDSRYFKFVHSDKVIGQVVARYWPIKQVTVNFIEENPE